MGTQSVKQAARRSALEAQAKRRRERAERDKRLEAIAVRVLVALAERDQAVTVAEQRAGVALQELTQDEGLPIREAVQWCADQITVREATRLRRIAADVQKAGGHEGE